MARVGFLLGAGASYPFGIPMMRELYTGFSEYVSIKRPHCSAMMDRITNKTQATLDLEALIAELDKIRAVRDGLDVLERSTGRDLEQDLETADELRGYLDAYLIEVCEQFSRDMVEARLTKFVKFCHLHESYIFSTNYDRLIETATDMELLPCIDGFERDSSRPESAWLGDVQQSGGVRLIKLHGSVNWYREDSTEKIFRLEKGYSLPSHEYRLTHGNRALRPLMIIPTLEKVVLQNPYATLLTAFSDALREIDLLIVIGNSMRDEHIRNTIGARLGGLEIISVNPNVEGHAAMFGEERTIHVLPVGMEEFIEVGIPMLAEVLGKALSDVDAKDVNGIVQGFVYEVVQAISATNEMSEDDRGLVHRLKTSPQDEKIEVMRNIGDTAHDEVVSLVRTSAESGATEAERIAAVDALVMLNDAGSIDLLFKIADNPSGLAVKAEAVLALKLIAERCGMDVASYMEKLDGQSDMMSALVASSVHSSQ